MPGSLTPGIVSAWLVVPTATVLLIAVSAHALSMRSGEMPESRRRIRMVNAWLMLAAVPLTSYALCLLDPKDTRWFVLTWAAVIGLIGIVIAVAVVDMLNTARLATLARRDLRTDLRARLSSRLAAAQASARDAQPTSNTQLRSDDLHR